VVAALHAPRPRRGAKDFAAANAHALALQPTEHAAPVDIERSANASLSGIPVLGQLAVTCTGRTHAAVAGVLSRTMVAMVVLVPAVYRAVPIGLIAVVRVRATGHASTPAAAVVAVSAAHGGGRARRGHHYLLDIAGSTALLAVAAA
jgi:hypothetical protein